MSDTRGLYSERRLTGAGRAAVFPCQPWADPPAKEGVSKSCFVACGALAPAHKKLQGEELLPLRKQAYLPGSLEPFPGRIQHPTLLVFTVQTSSLPQGSPRRKRGPHPRSGLPNSSEVRVRPGTTFYFCRRARFLVLRIWANIAWNPGQPTEVACGLLTSSFWQKMVHFKRRDWKTSWPRLFLGVGGLSYKVANLDS